jgi:serine/threonine protein kinase
MFYQNQLVGRYRVRKTIGSGGFGTVFLAEDTWLNTQVALKVPHQQTADLDALLAEPRVLAALDHPNILRIHTVAREGEVFFLVMEYVEGESLADRVDREGPLKLPAFLEIIGPVLAAVEHAHERNVVHRDLRPANILLGPEGRVKVADFGISKVLQRNGHAVTRIGSPPYMAPEQFAGRTVLQSDVYALGVIMYEMLTATLPIAEVQAEKVRQQLLAGRVTAPRMRNPAIPEHVNDVILKAMSLDVADRYARPAQIAASLLSRPPTPAEDGIREIRQRLKDRSDEGTRSLCWNCHRTVARRTTRCAHCGESL